MSAIRTCPLDMLADAAVGVIHDMHNVKQLRALADDMVEGLIISRRLADAVVADAAARRALGGLFRLASASPDDSGGE